MHEPRQPLSAAVFSILMALAEGEKHGYGIMKQALSAEGGAIKMGPGTLYGSLDRMLKSNLIAESGKMDSERRRYYKLTRSGKAALAAETSRLQRMLAGMKAKRPLQEARA